MNLVYIYVCVCVCVVYAVQKSDETCATIRNATSYLGINQHYGSGVYWDSDRHDKQGYLLQGKTDGA
jgi:hypothetical protein